MCPMSRPVTNRATRTLFAALCLLLTAACSDRPSAEDFTKFTQRKQAEGKLRIETDPPDAPFTRPDLARNFQRIALSHEADSRKAGSEANAIPNPLSRWEVPLRYTMIGAAVTPADRAETARLMARIEALTGLDIREDRDAPNFHIAIVAEDERDRFQDRLAAINPIMGRTYQFWRESPGIVCLANNIFADRAKTQLIGGLVLIGDEVTGLLRRACLHEEIVQSMGLANDHPEVRPSIFNDDGEFALLTRHDEFLLRILYDRRLRSGMEEAQAMPIVRSIAAGLDLDGVPALTN